MKISHLAGVLAALLVLGQVPSHGAQAPKSYKKALTLKADKNPKDPCPQGKWWHLTGKRCSPILCTTIPNDQDLPSRCPLKYHRHPMAIDPGADQGTPFTCSPAYSPYPDSDAGRARDPEDCPPCTDPAHAPRRFRPLSDKARRGKPSAQEETVTDEELARLRKNGTPIVDRYNPAIRKAFPGKIEKESRRVKLIEGVYTVVPPEAAKP